MTTLANATVRVIIYEEYDDGITSSPYRTVKDIFEMVDHDSNPYRRRKFRQMIKNRLTWPTDTVSMMDPQDPDSGSVDITHQFRDHLEVL